MAERIVVITGASAGIGAALAKRLATQGDRVVLAARREAELQAVAAQCAGRAITVVADVTRRADVERIRDEAVREFGRIDVWVNNVGRGITRNVLALTDDDIDAMVTVNLKSALYGMQAAVAHFQSRGGEGQLINVSSFLGRVPVATVRSAYSAMKSALNSLTANLRVDLAATHPNIHVTLVMPGIVSTEFAANAIGSTPGAGGSYPTAGPMKPQTAEEVADAIAGVIAKPVAELFTNPAHAEIAKRYFQDVGAFEAAARQPR